MKQAQNMSQTQQINILKKELKAVNQKINKLIQSSSKLSKTVAKLEKLSESSRAKRRLSYIDWLENERRMKDIF